MTPEFVYELFLTLDGKEQVFYTGRTKNIKRRLSEHRNAGLTKDTKLYQFIRQLSTADVQWDIRAVETFTVYRSQEYIHLQKLLNDGVVMYNSKAGDLQSLFKTEKRKRFKKLKSEAKPAAIDPAQEELKQLASDFVKALTSSKVTKRDA